MSVQALKSSFGSNCHWCGLPMDFAEPRSKPDSATIEHLNDSTLGGVRKQKHRRLSHAICNQTRNEFNQYFGLCAPSANAMYSSNYMSKLVLCGCYMLCCIVLGCALLCMLTCILAGGCNFCWSLNAQLQQRQQLCFRKCYEQQLPA